MAAPARPSLRSSSRKRTGLEEVTATDIQSKPLPNTRRGKRTRDISLDSLTSTAQKKQKPSPPRVSERTKESGNSRSLQTLPLRDKAGTPSALTSRPPNPASETAPPEHQQPVNGYATTIQQHNHVPATNPHLVPNTIPSLKPTDKRSLRSHDGGSRSKSELALYFPNYDELVSIEPKEPDLLSPETILHITDEPSKPKTTASSSKRGINANKIRFYSSSQSATPNGSSSALVLSEKIFTELNDATRINIMSFDKSTRHQIDPMDDTFYLKAHRRAERQEKQLRNIEKERAMHEKSQLERLMDGLKGHDWLRVMGISGITDGEKKAYEPKRDHFISEVRVLLRKFQAWKEEEKRRKVEKEESTQDDDEEPSSPSDEDDAMDDATSSPSSDGDPPDYNDVDASAARQLRQETILASNPPAVRLHRKKDPISSSSPAPPQPFTSFYTKPYLREAAISNHRRGRTRFAFGHPLPEPADREFRLGADILTADTLAASERKRRVAKRRTME